MIQLTDKIWIGDSKDESDGADHISAILNVAQDMNAYHGWGDGLEVMHVGLIDGPGNESAVYCAAVLALHTLVVRNRKVLVCCHSGGRALAVAVMYLILKAGKVSKHPTFLNHWKTWAGMVDELQDRLIPPIKGKGWCSSMVHQAHIAAFDKLPLALLEMML